VSQERAAQLVEAGLCLQLAGDTVGALRLWEEALRLDAGNSRARQLIERSKSAKATPAPRDDLEPRVLSEPLPVPGRGAEKPSHKIAPAPPRPAKTGPSNPFARPDAAPRLWDAPPEVESFEWGNPAAPASSGASGHTLVEFDHAGREASKSPFDVPAEPDVPWRLSPPREPESSPPSTLIQFPADAAAPLAAPMSFDEALRRSEQTRAPGGGGEIGPSPSTLIQYPERRPAPASTPAPSQPNTFVEFDVGEAADKGSGSTLVEFGPGAPVKPAEPQHTLRAFPSGDAPIAHSVSHPQTIGPGRTMVQYPAGPPALTSPGLAKANVSKVTPPPPPQIVEATAQPLPAQAPMPTPPVPSLSPGAAGSSAWEEAARGRMEDLGPAGGAKDDALGLVHVTPPPRAPTAQDQRLILLHRAKDLLDLADHSGALDVVEKVLAVDPENVDAKQIRERCRTQLLAMFESKIGRLDRRPKVVVKSEEIIWLNLDHRAGFVLSQVDGGTTFEQLFSVSGMGRLDTAKILVQLIEQKVISAS
jgi:hypothetical protein